jgi:hypothetical protein
MVSFESLEKNAQATCLTWMCTEEVSIVKRSRYGWRKDREGAKQLGTGNGEGGMKDKTDWDSLCGNIPSSAFRIPRWSAELGNGFLKDSLRNFRSLS